MLSFLIKESYWEIVFCESFSCEQKLLCESTLTRNIRLFSGRRVRGGKGGGQNLVLMDEREHV